MFSAFQDAASPLLDNVSATENARRGDWAEIKQKLGNGAPEATSK